MRVVMLDIDGVLNNHYTKERRTDAPCIVGLDPINVEVFNDFMVKATDDRGISPVIVVSSSWRIGITESALEKMLRAAGIAYPVHDSTPNVYKRFSDTQSGSRTYQIEQWLKACKDPVEGLVILDDLTILGPLRQYQVQTDAYVGLLKRHGVRAASTIKEPFDVHCIE